MSEKPVVFVNLGTAYLPVVLEMERLRPSTYLTYGENLHDELVKAGLESIRMADDLDAELQKIAKRPELAGLLERYEKLPLPGFWPNHLGWPEKWVVEAQWRLERAKQHRIRQQILMIEMLDVAVEKHRPTLALLWEDVLMDGKTFALFFHERGVPTLHVAHGLSGFFHNAHDRVWADRIAVQGERTREWYARFGNPPEKIAVTGGPYWDRYVRLQQSTTCEAARQMLGLDPARPVVAFFSTWTHSLSAHSDPHLVRRSYRLFLRAAAALGDDVQWVVKPHPSDQKGAEWYEREARGAGLEQPVILKPVANTEALVIAADALICVDSMVGAAGVLCRRPVFNISLVHYHEPLFHPHDPVQHVRTSDELADGLTRALRDPAALGWEERHYERSIYELNYLHDGRASERVARLALQMEEKRAHRVRSFRYYSHPREELESLIPREAVRVLDVGCATGALGAHLKSRRPWTEVWGVEMVEEAAEEARRRLDRVVVGDISSDATLGDEKFDCIVFSDVLEHLQDPWQILEKTRARLTDGGCVVASIPNVGHWSVLGELLTGRWRYAEEGILDRDHVRFFTLEGIRALFDESGWVIEEQQEKATPEHALMEGFVRLGKEFGLDERRLRTEMTVFQYLVRARPKAQVLACRLAEGEDLLSTGRFGEAIRMFEEALRLDGTEPRALLGLARANLAERRLARAFQVLGQWAGCPSPSASHVCSYYRLMGEALLLAKKPESAAEMFRRTLGVDPRSVTARIGLWRARLAYEGGGVPPGEMDAMEELALADDEGLSDLAGLCRETGDVERARRLYRKRLATCADHRASVLGLAETSSDPEARKEALASLSAYLELHPADADVHCRRIELMAELGELDGAQGAAERLVAIRPDHAEARRLHGWLKSGHLRPSTATTDVSTPGGVA